MFNPDQLANSLELSLLTELRELMEDDFVVLLQTYLDDSQVRMGSLEQAVLSHDPFQIRQSAHSLKGSSANMGAYKLASLCQLLEQLGRQSDLTGAFALLEQIKLEYLQVKFALNFILDNPKYLA